MELAIQLEISELLKSNPIMVQGHGYNPPKEYIVPYLTSMNFTDAYRRTVDPNTVVKYKQLVFEPNGKHLERDGVRIWIYTFKDIREL